MSVSDFHDIVVRRDSGKAERLFRASVSAFCSITRPSRREAAQLDDLTLPLFDLVSTEDRRFVAAALSECAIVPAGLFRRLLDEPVDVAAPLLVRSRVLTDVELIALIGRHGIGHARAIGRRKRLNPAIQKLIVALEGSIVPTARIHESRPADHPEREATAAANAERPGFGEAAEAVRHRLRAMMRADTVQVPEGEAGPGDMAYRKLRDAALTGSEMFLATALADTLTLNLPTARALLSSGGDSSLLAAFRSLDLSEEQAYMLATLALPGHFPHPEAVRLFLERFRSLDPETARERVRGWKLEMVANWIQWQSANARGEPPGRRRGAAGLRAS
ncbi:MAG: hypothetical protein KF914_11825 [Rhizobiaceae bacterium]|nr:hypothetical protein [Rhizobiaceae bacterium]